MTLEELRKDFGEDVHAYRQEYGGAPMTEEGYSDEYVHYLEQKLTSDNSDSPSPKLPSREDILTQCRLKGRTEIDEDEYINDILQAIRKLGDFE